MCRLGMGADEVARPKGECVMAEVEMWVIYEAAARGIAQGRAGRRANAEGAQREPTDAERLWARLAVDAALPYVRQEAIPT